MAEAYPYPEQEHYEEPKNPLQVIDEELRIYRDSEDFRRGVITIGRIYKDTDLMYCFKKYAYLMNVANISVGRGSSGSGIDADFYGGTILGMHSMLKPAPKPLRQRLLRTDTLEDYSPWSDPEDQDNAALGQAVTQLASFQAGEWTELFELQPLEHQERITNMGIRLYQDVENGHERNKRWESFAAGYLFSSNLIVYTVSEMN